MKHIGLIAESQEPTTIFNKVYSCLDQLGFNLVYIYSKQEIPTSIQTEILDCFLVILSNNSADSDVFRDKIREMQRSGKPYFILASSEEIQDSLFEIPYHLRDQTYIDLDAESFCQILKAHLTNSDNSLLRDATIYILPDVNQTPYFVEFNQNHPNTNIQNLRHAWLKTWNFAKTDITYYDELSYKLYHNYLDANLVVLSDLLQKGEFALQPLFCLSVPKTSLEDAAETGQKSDTRELYFAQPETAIVLQAICDFIAPMIENVLDLVDEKQTNNSLRVTYANRVIIDQQDTVEIFYHWRESHSRFRHAIKGFANQYPESTYFRTDIQKYYPSIDTVHLKWLLESYIQDDFVLKLLDQFLNLTSVDNDGNEALIPGIPAGIPLAHLLANLYLHDVDREMSTKALRYFRYVDDVVFFAENEKDQIDLRSYFKTLLQNLGQNGLQIYLPTDNPNKSFEGLSSDIEKLDIAIDHLSPLLRIDFSQFPEGSQRERLGEFIYEALITIENAEDKSVEEIYAKYAALAVYKLKELEYRQDLSDIVYKFLRKAPLRSRTIRSLIDYLVQRIIENPEELSQFEHFLSDPITSDFLTLAFLQSLRAYKKLPNHIWGFVRRLTELENIIIVGEALYTHYQHGRTIKNSKASLIKRFFSTRHTFYLVRSYLYFSSLNISENDLLKIVNQLLNSGDPQQQSIVFSSAKHPLDLRITQNILKISAEINLSLISLASFAFWIRLNIESPLQKNIRERLVNVLILQTVRLSAQARGDLLASAFGSVLTLEEVNRVQSDLLSAQQAKMLLERQSSNSDTIMYFNKYRKIGDNERLENPYRHDYLSIQIEWDDNREGFLEIIRYNLLQSRGFKEIQEWIVYLRQVENKGIVTIVDVVDLQNGNIAIIYEIPAGYNRLTHIFSNSTSKPYFSVSDIFLLLSNINTQAAKAWISTGEADYRFITVHSDFVLVKNDGDVEFLCLGASLDNTPRYLVSNAHLDENKIGIEDANAGFEAYSLFLAYLLVELLLGQNPIFLSRNLDKNQFLSDIELLDVYQAHIKGFIARAANTVPKFRYKDYASVSLDLENIRGFFHYLDTHDSLSTEQMLLAEFVDYMRLRLGTHARNPEIASQPSEKRPLDLSLSISKDFVRFAPNGTDKRQWLIDQYNLSDPKNYIDHEIIDWCSVPSQKLLKTYAFWQRILEEYQALPDTHVDFDLHIISETLTTYIIWIERTAYVQNLGRWAGNHYKLEEIKPEGLGQAKYLLQKFPLSDLDMTNFNFSASDGKVVEHSLVEISIQLSKSKFRAARKLGLASPTILFSLSASRSLAIFDKHRNLIWHSNTEDLVDDEKQKANWRLSTAHLLREYYQRLEAVFPPANKKTAPSMDTTGKPRAFITNHHELPPSFDRYAYKRLFIHILDGLKESHSGKRVTGNIISYSAKPKSFDTAEGRIKLQQDKAPHPFSEFDLVEKQDQVSLPSDGALATVDLYYKPNRNDPNIGAILVTPANLFEIFPENANDREIEDSKMRDQIFISYSHENRDEWYLELRKRLRPLETKHIVKAWSDQDIKVSDKWRQAIIEARDTAKVAILLLTPEFFASDFIDKNELNPIIESHKNNEIKIIAIACTSTNHDDYNEYLGEIQWPISPDNPLDLMPKAEQNRAWVTIIKEIKKAFEN